MKDVIAKKNPRNEEEIRRMAVSPPTLISNLTTDPKFYIFLGPVVYLLLFILM